MIKENELENINIRDLYSCEMSRLEGNNGIEVTVKKKVNDDETVVVAKYKRDFYDMGATFEPFRQYHNGQWKDYALISREYVRLAVLDLQTGEVIAEESYIRVDEWLATNYPDKYTLGEEIPGMGFCPLSFYVPAWNDVYNPHDIKYKDVETIKYNGSQEDKLRIVERSNESVDKALADIEENFLGQWGVYSGCYWGDDSSMKLRYVDLSKISEGIVTTDERFGYFELAGMGFPLREEILIRRQGSIVAPLPITLDVKTGKGRTHTPATVTWDDDNLNKFFEERK